MLVPPLIHCVDAKVARVVGEYLVSIANGLGCSEEDAAVSALAELGVGSGSSWAVDCAVVGHSCDASSESCIDEGTVSALEAVGASVVTAVVAVARFHFFDWAAW